MSEVPCLWFHSIANENGLFRTINAGRKSDLTVDISNMIRMETNIDPIHREICSDTYSTRITLSIIIRNQITGENEEIIISDHRVKDDEGSEEVADTVVMFNTFIEYFTDDFIYNKQWGHDVVWHMPLYLNIPDIKEIAVTDYGSVYEAMKLEECDLETDRGKECFKNNK